MSSKNCFRHIALLATGLVVASAAFAHNYAAGDIRIQDPFATPSRVGAPNGAAYFASLENRGEQADRLIRASSPVAARIELHFGKIGADGVMRMREVDALPLPPKAIIKLRPGQGDHLMLIDLKRPLVEGETFPMTLEFERGGKVEVKVSVQVPKPGAKDASEHKH